MKNINYVYCAVLAFLLFGLSACEKENLEPQSEMQTKKREIVAELQNPCDDGPSIPGQLEGTPICTAGLNWEVVGNWEVNVEVSPFCSDLTLVMYYADGTVIFETDLYEGVSNFFIISPAIMADLMCGAHYIMVFDECEVYHKTSLFSLGNC